MAWHGVARQGQARQGLAGPGEATHTAHFTECAEAWSGVAWLGTAWRGAARRGQAWRGYTHGAFHGVRRSVVWRGGARLG